MANGLQCDVVMRGGITSGIVYPLAVTELANTYDFRSIGGTSAGAIAAAVTAAAAYGKAGKANPDAFKLIAAIPGELAQKGPRGGTALEDLFAADKPVRRLFRVLKSFIAPTSEEQSKTYLVIGSMALVRAFWGMALIGALPGIVVVGGAAWLGANAQPASVLTLIVFLVMAGIGLVGAGIGAILASIVAAKGVIERELHKNFYGLCSGMPPKDVADEDVLTTWLHRKIQEAAGDREGILTVEMLRGPDPKDPKIDLRLMTTNVTLGQPRMFPNLEKQDEGDQIYFRQDELERLFPADVVDDMVKNSQTAEKSAPYLRLPKPDKLPVLFGARLSLSFPFLLSAVPLYHAEVDHEGKTSDPPRLRCCWYSDGGLTSNFPIHLFDSPIPMRPTFCINLAPATASTSRAESKADGWEHISMPVTNEQKGLQRFNLFDQDTAGSPIERKSNVFGFFAALFDTARNWQDSRLMMMPGYQDRIVTVHLKDNEGGYRLNMPEKIITDVSERGRLAGQLLSARFSGETSKDPCYQGTPIELNWENHRRVRLRATLAALEDYARDISKRWHRADVPAPATRSYEDKTTNDNAPYPFLDLREAIKAIDILMVAFGKLYPGGSVLDNPAGTPDNGRSPRPKPELKLRPQD